MIVDVRGRGDESQEERRNRKGEGRGRGWGMTRTLGPAGTLYRFSSSQRMPSLKLKLLDGKKAMKVWPSVARTLVGSKVELVSYMFVFLARVCTHLAAGRCIPR